MKKILISIAAAAGCFMMITGAGATTGMVVSGASMAGSGMTETGAISASCVKMNDGCNTCARSQNGEWACTLMACSPENTGAPICLSWKDETPIEPVMCTMQYQPVCASIQVQCFAAPCPAIEETFGNACAMSAHPQATFLYEGECGNPTATGVIVGGDVDIYGCKASA